MLFELRLKMAKTRKSKDWSIKNLQEVFKDLTRLRSKVISLGLFLFSIFPWVLVLAP